MLQENVIELQAVPQPAAERPVRIFCQDESRVGLLPVQRRRSTVSGVNPVGPVHDQFEHFSRYGAVEPTTGASFVLAWPQLNTVNFQSFLKEVAPHDQETLTIGLLDHGRCHQAKALVIPDELGCLFLPPSSPARNPIERLGHDLKERLAWVPVAPLDALERPVETPIRP